MKGKLNMVKKILKIAFSIILAVAICILLLFAEAFFGNPISKHLATKSANEYLTQTYGDTDFYVESVNYNFKFANYYARVKSPSSADTQFNLTVDKFGNLQSDTYESRVLGRFNTAQRIDDEYRNLANTVFESPTFPYGGDISFGTIECFPESELGKSYVPTYALNQNELVLDKEYDIFTLGSKHGHIIMYVQNEDISAEKAAEIILDLKSILDNKGVPFYAMDFVLRKPKPLDDTPWSDEQISVKNLLYTDIYPENFSERIQEAHNIKAESEKFTK